MGHVGASSNTWLARWSAGYASGLLGCWWRSEVRRRWWQIFLRPYPLLGSTPGAGTFGNRVLANIQNCQITEQKQNKIIWRLTSVGGIQNKQSAKVLLGGRTIAVGWNQESESGVKGGGIVKWRPHEWLFTVHSRPYLPVRIDNCFPNQKKSSVMW